MLNPTRVQLERLGFPRIGIELKDGSKHFGTVTKFTQHKIYFEDKSGTELDVPRRIIARALLCIKGGGKDDDKPTGFFESNRSTGAAAQ